MIRYDPRAAKAIGYLKRGQNEVEIYVEDKAGQAMWNRLVRQLLPQTVRFESVTMLGGRDAVEKACSLDQQVDGRRRLYIVDADLDYLLGRAKARLRHLYRLRACTVENLLASPALVSEVAIDFGNFANLRQAEAAVDFSGRVLAHEVGLRALTATYALEQSLDLRGKRPRVKAGSLLERVEGGDEISERKIYRAILPIFRALITQFGSARVRGERQKILERQSKLDLARAVLGKDYIFPVVCQQLARRCGCRISPSQVRVQLARVMVPSIEPYLARRLASL